MKTNGILPAISLLLLTAANLIAQPEPELLDEIARLVEAGKLEEAKAKTRNALIFYDDPTLNEIQVMLVEKTVLAPDLIEGDKATAEYWLRICDKLVGELKANDYRKWQIYYALGLTGQAAEAFLRLDSLVANQKINSYFRDGIISGNLAFGLLEGGHLEEAVALLPHINNPSMRGRLAAGIAIFCSNTTPEKTRFVFTQVENDFALTQYLEELRGIEDAYARSSYIGNLIHNLTNLALAAAGAGFPEKADHYLGSAAEILSGMESPETYLYSQLGFAYAKAGQLELAENAFHHSNHLKETYDFLAISSLAQSYRNLVDIRRSKEDAEGARRFLMAGREALATALTKYEDAQRTAPEIGYIERILPETLLQESMEQAIREEQPVRAWRLFQADERNLTDDFFAFQSIFLLHLRSGLTAEARKLLENLERESEIQAALGNTRLRFWWVDSTRVQLASAILAHEGVSAYETYIASLPVKLTTRFDLAEGNVRALVLKNMNSPKSTP